MPEKLKDMILAVSGESGVKDLANVKGVAYNGKELSQDYSSHPIYIDLDNMEIAAQVPLLYSHWNDPSARLGVVTATKAGNQLHIAGGIDPETQRGGEIIKAGRKYDWQLSVGVKVNGWILLKEDEKTTVNGREVAGPAYITGKAVLREVSVVAVGANEGTHLEIAAALNLSSPGIQANQKGESKMEKEVKPTPEEIRAQLETEIKARLQQEAGERIAGLTKITARHPDLFAKAMAENWSEKQTLEAVIEKIEAGQKIADAPVPHAVAKGGGDIGTLQAGLMLACAVDEKSIIKATSEQAIEAADKAYKGELGIKGFLWEAARMNGYISASWGLTSGNMKEVLQAAWSNANVSNILSNVANKKLLEGFSVVDQSWREIATKVSTADFKPVKSLQLNVGGGFKTLTNGGNFPVGEFNESGYSVNAETRGLLVSITREMIINDDLGAFNQIPMQLGLAAAQDFNRMFWTVFLDDASFFSDGNGNLLASNALSVDGLSAALKKFRDLRDAGGNKLGVNPSVLLVSASNEQMADSLYSPAALIAIGTNSGAKTASSLNAHAGKYKPVVSPFLDDTTLNAAATTTAYYLLANPAFKASMQVAFLNGRETPFIQSSDANFNTLGIEQRVFYDAGCALGDKLAGVKVTGA